MNSPNSPFDPHQLLRRYSEAAPGDTENSRHGLTLAQWLARLNDYLPAAYLRMNATHLYSLWTNGETVENAFAYARACMCAPTVCPKGWENVRAVSSPALLGQDGAANYSPPYPPAGLRRLLEDIDPGE